MTTTLRIDVVVHADPQLLAILAHLAGLDDAALTALTQKLKTSADSLKSAVEQSQA